MIQTTHKKFEKIMILPLFNKKENFPEEAA